MGGKATNKVEVVINRQKFDALLGDRSIKDFYDELVDKWDIGLGYKSFVNLLNNRVSWKLIHAYAVADCLERNIEQLFVVTPVDEEERERKRQIERESKMRSIRRHMKVKTV
jgi:hypothetical protein